MTPAFAPSNSSPDRLEDSVMITSAAAQAVGILASWLSYVLMGFRPACLGVRGAIADRLVRRHTGAAGAYIADVTPVAERTRNSAQSLHPSGLGLILGPAAGESGQLRHTHAVFSMAAFLSSPRSCTARWFLR